MLLSEVEKKSVSLYQVARRTKISQQVIIAILKEAGFVIYGYSSNLILNEKHIAVLSAYYVDAVKNLFSNSKKDVERSNSYEIEQLRRFLSFFIDDSNSIISDGQTLTIEEVLDSEIEDVLINDFFYSLAFDIKEYDYKIYSKILYEIQYKINPRLIKKNTDLRTKFFPFLISNHYHIFSDEEDHRKVANPNFCFSFVNLLFREAIINSIIYLKLLLKWKTLNYS